MVSLVFDHVFFLPFNIFAYSTFVHFVIVIKKKYDIRVVPFPVFVYELKVNGHFLLAVAYVCVEFYNLTVLLYFAHI